MSKGEREIKRILEEVMIRVSHEIAKHYSIPNGCKFCGSNKIIKK